MAYVQINRVFHENGEYFEIGQRRIVKRPLHNPQYRLSGGFVADDVFTIKNIVHPENSPDHIYLCCEFEKDIGGHRCAVDSHYPWAPMFLCKEGHGEYMKIKEAAEHTEALGAADPSWEV